MLEEGIAKTDFNFWKDLKGFLYLDLKCLKLQWVKLAKIFLI